MNRIDDAWRFPSELATFRAKLDTPYRGLAPPRAYAEAVVLDLAAVATVGDVGTKHSDIIFFGRIRPLGAHVERDVSGLQELACPKGP